MLTQSILKYEPCAASAITACFHKPKPVVIVDNSLDDRLLLSGFLSTFLPRDQQIISLKSGRDLLSHLGKLEKSRPIPELFEMEVPSIIFMELMMPGLDGLQIMRALRMQPVWSNMPVILVTSSRDDAAIQKAADLGAKGFLPKPFTKVEVMQAVSKAYNYMPSVI